MTLSDTRKAEITAIMAEIKTHTHELARHGIDATDPRDVLDAIDIIQRIERKIYANLQAAPAHPTHEAPAE